MNFVLILVIFLPFSIEDTRTVGRETDENELRDCSDPNNIYLPSTATNTTLRLMALRQEMISNNVSAYIVPSSDAHLSEYVASRDRRRQWLTGFTGSAGTAVVTSEKAAVWTDGRYFLQAERQLDCNWILMRLATPDVPSIEEWILNELPEGSSVGAHPFLFSVGDWENYVDAFNKKNIKFIEVIPDLIDVIWEDRPVLPSNSLLILPQEYSGKTWQTKLEEIRNEMTISNVDYILLTRLDEIAWFFNLRGNDVPYTPVFTSYVIVPTNKNVILFANQSLFSDDVIQSHLNKSDCGESASCVIVNPYNEARNALFDLSIDESTKIWLPSDSTTYGMYSVVNQIYDAIALSEYLQWLELNVPLGGVTEISGSEKLKSFRLAQPTNQGLSFGSISASGPNGAVIHYGATPETNRNLSTSEMYMIDSGGQYLGGTTDVTRTVHYGDPTPFQKETFTRALMGQIDVQRAIFPYNKKGRDLDILARRYLYEIGLEYQHGTGHGVGQFLCIHEYPPGFGTSSIEDYYLFPGMFTSVEPGYYEAGSFGLRHENINVVVEATTKHNFQDYKFYTFEPVTLVPFQTKLIEVSLMKEEHIIYLNDYHKKVGEIIGAEAERQGKLELKQWIDSAIVPLPTGSSPRALTSTLLIAVASLISIFTTRLSS